MFYEHDSTPDYIVITPGNGYEIESITINDEDIEITDPKGMTLENFIGLTEDKNIKVSFTEESIEVPITGKNSKLIVIFILLALMVTITLLVNKTKNKILKIER